MKQRVHQCIVILLALLVAMQTLLLLGHQMALSVHKMAVERQLYKSAETTTIILSATEFNNAKVESKELIIAGRYFDIIKLRAEDDCVMVTGFFDHEEKILKKNIEGKLEHQAADKLSHFLKWLLMAPVGSTLESLQAFAETRFSHQFVYHSHMTSALKGTPFKPPIV